MCIGACNGKNEEFTGESDTVPIVTTEESEKSTDESKVDINKKAIDIYIIAGQSNAAGCTNVSESDAKKIEALWEYAATGVESVIYMGSPTSVEVGNKCKDWTFAKIGLGVSEKHMGPEVGMAEVLNNDYYGRKENLTAGIIKYAHGGTALLDQNTAGGNWVSPSYAESLNKEHTGSRGILYRDLLKEVEIGIFALKEDGYTDINIKGLFWMQGETDRYYPEEYEKALKFFISDIRRDLGSLVNEDLSKLPFIIGEISRTTESASPEIMNVNNTFINMQRKIAAETENVYIVASSKYDVNKWENGISFVVQDGWHWCAEDIFYIGEEVGDCIINNILN